MANNDPKETGLNLHLPDFGLDAGKTLGKIITSAQEKLNQYEDLQTLWANSRPSRRENKVINRWMDLYKITGSNVIAEMIRNKCLKTISDKGLGRKDNIELVKTGFTIQLDKKEKRRR